MCTVLRCVALLLLCFSGVAVCVLWATRSFKKRKQERQTPKRKEEERGTASLLFFCYDTILCMYIAMPLLSVVAVVLLLCAT